MASCPLFGLLTAVSSLSTNLDKRVNKVNAKALSIINTCVNKVNAAFTNVNATAPKFGGGVSLFFRCAAPSVPFELFALSGTWRNLTCDEKLLRSRPAICYAVAAASCQTLTFISPLKAAMSTTPGACSSYDSVLRQRLFIVRTGTCKYDKGGKSATLNRPMR
jgi:hypothetical protein